MKVCRLDPRLSDYLATLRTLMAAPLSEATRLRRAREAALELAARPVVLAPEDRRVPASGYGRNLLHRDPSGFVVIAMVWPPGTGGRPHDHGTWGVVAVTEGEVEVTNFEREDDGSDVARRILRPLGTIRAGVGAVATVLPPHDDFHSVRNAGRERLAVTIHTYGCEPRRSNVVDLATGATEIVSLVYDNS
jgi:predicted metal-dependent enzyme (double-stranded beta helix superfamily)